jgi:hypothetical protein
MNTQPIGSIRNYYGGLDVKQEEDKYYWAIENWDGHYWEEIPKELYDMLIAFNEGAVNE